MKVLISLQFQENLNEKIVDMKIAYSTVIGFRVDCAKNFPARDQIMKTENPGLNFPFLTILMAQKIFPVIWKNIRYNFGDAYNASTGIFTCPYDGIYSFYASSSMLGQYEGHIFIQVNGSIEIQHYFRNYGEHEYKHISPHGEFNLKKGDSVQIGMTGVFYRAGSNCLRTYFQGHLVALL